MEQAGCRRHLGLKSACLTFPRSPGGEREAGLAPSGKGTSELGKGADTRDLPAPQPCPMLEVTALLGQWQASCDGDSTLGLVGGRLLVWAAPGPMPSSHNKVLTSPSCSI